MEGETGQIDPARSIKKGVENSAVRTNYAFAAMR